MRTARQRELHSPVSATDAEAGYMLLAVIVMVALILIALSVAAPVVARQLRRDKELESQHRAEQYVRAIQLYYRKTKSYPPSIAALENTNNVRFLRKQYVDPLTGRADWRLIHLAQQQTTVKGFFGQELGGISSSGLGGAAPAGTAGVGATSSTSTIGATSALASGFSGASLTSSTPGTPGSTGATGSSGGLGDGTGGVIVGVGTSRTGSSVTEPNGQSTYDTWEFWYDPRIELLKQGVNVTGGGVAAGGLSSQSATTYGATGSTGSTGASGTTGSSGPGIGSGNPFP